MSLPVDIYQLLIWNWEENVISPLCILKYVQFSSSIGLPLTLLSMFTTKKEYLNQAIAFFSSDLPPSSITVHAHCTSVVGLSNSIPLWHRTRTSQFRKAYLAMLGIHDDHLHDACLYVLYMLNTSIRCVWDNSCMQTGLYSSNDRITSYVSY